MAPSRARPVWFVTSPTRLPSQRRELLRAQHVDAGHDRRARRRGAGDGPQAPKSRPVDQPRVAQRLSARRSIADAAIVATRARSGVTSPLPSGCTRFDRKTTNILVAGSIQSDVPVKPV